MYTPQIWRVNVFGKNFYLSNGIFNKWKNKAIRNTNFLQELVYDLSRTFLLYYKRIEILKAKW